MSWPYGEIIAIGDELISGRVTNTTSSFLAKRLASQGFRIKRITTIGDDRDEMIACIRDAVKRSDFLFITGGLGPTSDDLTTEAVAKAFGLELVINQDILNTIKANQAYCAVTPEHMLQRLATTPEGATPLNPKGKAAGYMLRNGNKPVFCLPGVPSQVAEHLEKNILGFMKQYLKEGATQGLSCLFKLFGVGETELNHQIDNIFLKYDKGIHVGYYPAFPEVELYILVPANHPESDDIFHKACDDIFRIWGDYIVAINEETIESNLGFAMLKKDLKLAVAESCTGGLIASRLTRVPGSSGWFERGVVCYSNQSKIDILGVREETLLRYGAVSQETAKEMALGMARNASALAENPCIAVAVTGIAGPSGGSEAKPVGTVFIAIAIGQEVMCKKFSFSGSRHEIQQLSAESAISWLQREIARYTNLHEETYWNLP